MHAYSAAKLLCRCLLHACYAANIVQHYVFLFFLFYILMQYVYYVYFDEPVPCMNFCNE